MLALVTGIGITAYSQTVTIKCTETRHKFYDEVYEEWGEWTSDWQDATENTIQITKVVDDTYSVSILWRKEVKFTLVVIYDADNSTEDWYVYYEKGNTRQIWTGNVSLGSLVKGITVWNPRIHSLWYVDVSGDLMAQLR